MTTWTLSGRALLPDGAFAESTLRVDDSRIAEVQKGADPTADLVAAGWIVPGFIDLQVNGGFGYDLTSDASTVSALAARLPATGVTSFLATLITSPLEAYPRLLRDLQSAQAHLPSYAAQFLGAHLEGPYLNLHRRGAHDPALLRTPAGDDLDAWVSSPIVRLVTLAPELPGALEWVSRLHARGIAVSAGHSDATYAEAVAGFSAGISWGTHLFNAMSPLVHRAPGLVGAFLSSDVPCGLIVDGIHVQPAAVQTAWRAKGIGITLVTDAMAAMGMPSGEYVLGDRPVHVEDGSARLADGALAGSVLTMDTAVRNMTAFTGCSLAEAATLASTTPARVLGLTQKGQIAPGYDADLVLLDESLHVSRVVLRGQPQQILPAAL